MESNSSSNPTSITPSSAVRLSEWEGLFIGAVGGTIETSIQMPLIIWKICKQQNKPYPTTVRDWYRGVLINASSLAPITALQCVANIGLQQIVTLGSPRPLSDVEQLLCSAGAGAISAFIYCPVDLLVIQQNQLKTSLSGAFNHVRSTYGSLKLFRGLLPTMVRESIYTMGYLGIAPVVQTNLIRSNEWFRHHPVTSSFLGACLGGIVANVLTQPTDTAKTRIQTDLAGKTYPNATWTTKYLYQQGGIGDLYRGGVPRTLRACGAAFVIAQVREAVVRYKEWEETKKK